ncbi:MAG: histidine phosphatase family protein [Pseudomonadota bacterium]
MTHRLILMRHAKSSWTDLTLEDHDRPLNGRGERSAEAMGRWMKDEGLSPDITLCSTAQRTQQTLDLLNLTAEPILMRSLYHATEDGMLGLLQQQKAPTVLLVGHNPGIGALAQLLAKKPPKHERFHDYPTCATTVLHFDTDDWTKVGPGRGQVQNFLIPADLEDADQKAR